MSDNPTPLALWRPAEDGEQSWGTLRLLFGGTVAVATASRADLLAALGAEWRCDHSRYTAGIDCNEANPCIRDSCGWFVEAADE